MRQKHQYKVASIAKTPSPDGIGRTQWYRYVGKNECTRITGFRPGSRQEVQDYAEDAVNRLNTRTDRGLSTNWTLWPHRR